MTRPASTLQKAQPEYNMIEEQNFRRQMEQHIDDLWSSVGTNENVTGPVISKSVRRHQFLFGIPGIQ